MGQHEDTGGGLNNPSVFDRVGEGVAVSELITDFGRTRNLAEGAKAQVKAASQGAEAARAIVLLNVEANYLAALQAEAVLGSPNRLFRAANSSSTGSARWRKTSSSRIWT